MYRTIVASFNWRTAAYHIKTLNSEDGAHLDVSTQGFWGDHHQRAFFYVRVFNPNAPSYRKMQLPSAYRLHERQKQRSYDQCVQEVEHGSFNPLVFTTSGGMGKCAFVTYKRLASLLSTKQEQSYAATIAWIRCCLSLSLLHSSIMCLRSARSSQGRAFRSSVIDLAVAEAKVPSVFINCILCVHIYHLTLYTFLFTLVFIYYTIKILLSNE